MNLRPILTLLLLDAATFALSFAAAAILTELLARPWRRAPSAHWTERAKLAFAPNFATLTLAAFAPPLLAFLGYLGLASIDPHFKERVALPLAAAWLSALLGILAARARWLRQAIGPRVTLRSYFTGWLVLLLAIVPHYLIVILLFFILPDQFNLRAVTILAAGVLALAFFAWGGGVKILSLLRIVRPAPAPITEMVHDLARRMRVPGDLKVIQLEWMMANALAWSLHRAVGFSRPLLESMTHDEIRAIAAHELAHLIEPRWVRALRLAHLFAYLPLVPIMKYGGLPGLGIGYILFIVILLAYQRFTRRFEHIADQVERHAIDDPSAYMRSLIKLHQINLLPAVMPGSQTHPHLYERLIAGGIHPDFPRPAPPSRLRPFLASLFALLLVLVVLFILIVVAGAAIRIYDRTSVLPSAPLRDSALLTACPPMSLL